MYTPFLSQNHLQVFFFKFCVLRLLLKAYLNSVFAMPMCQAWKFFDEKLVYYFINPFVMQKGIYKLHFLSNAALLINSKKMGLLFNVEKQAIIIVVTITFMIYMLLLLIFVIVSFSISRKIFMKHAAYTKK